MGETITFDNKIVVNVKEENKSCKYFILTNDLFEGIGKSLLIFVLLAIQLYVNDL
jgi:hypothetical protein